MTEVLGKDGKPFDRDRYVSWGLTGQSSLELGPMHLQPHKPTWRKGRNIGWRCPICERSFKGAAIVQHRAGTCEPFSMFAKGRG